MNSSPTNNQTIHIIYTHACIIFNKVEIDFYLENWLIRLEDVVHSGSELGLQNCREEVKKRREIGGFCCVPCPHVRLWLGRTRHLIHTMFARGRGEHNVSFLSCSPVDAAISCCYVRPRSVLFRVVSFVKRKNRWLVL